MKACDVAIVGAGVMGLSTAWHLLSREPGLDVTLVERDPSWEFASTARSLGGVRQQFSLPENIRMSQYGRAFYRAFGETMAVDGDEPDIGYRTGGYLFLLGEDARDAAIGLNRVQNGLGARTELLERDAIAARFPSLSLDGVGLASWGPDDGWTDPHAIMTGLRRKVAAMGGSFHRGEVRSFAVRSERAAGVDMADGGRIEAGHAVCAAGAWSGPLLARAGVEVPVVPVRRMVFFFETPARLENLPLTIAPSGLYFRPEGSGYLAGRSLPDEPEGENFEVDHDFFERTLWPELAEACPAFETLRLIRGWSGLYDINRLDANMIAGPHPDGPANLHVLCGFSGHGLQHAPAAGRAIAELILDGEFRTLDLARLSCARLVTGEALPESGIV